MKKLLSILLASILAISIVGCSNTPKKEESSIQNAVEILSTVWSSYKEDQKFAAMGGDYNNMTENEPGKLDVTDKESLKSLLIVPEDSADLIDDAASLIHAMNANTFTGAAFHLKDSKNMETFTKSLQDAIMNNQWMCGFPEKMILVQMDDSYVVSAFGNGELMETFQTLLTKAYPSAKIIAEENF